jgi:hypothetical protein
MAIKNAIGLRARRTDGRTLAGIENAELDAGLVRRERHRAPERIDLLDQMALADSADRGIAGHLPERFDVVRQKQRCATHPRAGECRLGAGMSPADDYHIEFMMEQHDY